MDEEAHRRELAEAQARFNPGRSPLRQTVVVVVMIIIGIFGFFLLIAVLGQSG